MASNRRVGAASYPMKLPAIGGSAKSSFVISTFAAKFRMVRYSFAFGPIVSELSSNTWKIFSTKRTIGVSLDSLEIALET